MADLLTTAQAAEAMGVSTQRIRQLIAEGRLSATKVGRDWLVKMPRRDPRKATGRPQAKKGAR